MIEPQCSSDAAPGAARQTLQCAPAALLVRPARFGYNPQTAHSNRFQRDALRAESSEAQVLVEFESLRSALHSAGVRQCVAFDTHEPIKPDAVFPNNWISFHRDGTIVLYPMHAPNRRLERRMEILAAVERELNFRRRRVLDLSPEERRGRFLEGTGSLVLDHVERVAYACRSARTDESLVREWARLMAYEPELFDATDGSGMPLYHTNVMLAIGSRCVIICSDALAYPDRARVLERLRASGREIIEIGLDAMRGFAGNMLELRVPGEAAAAQSVFVMSARARANLSATQWGQLSAVADRILAIAVPTIETFGGGSVRCMLAEVPERDT